MRKISGILTLFISVLLLKGTIVFAEKTNYLVDGIKFRGEGKCEESIRSYQLARKHKQFKEDWAYHLAVADCYVALKKYDEAIDAYTRVLDATRNKFLQAEMYKGRGKAYYLKAVKADTLDKKYLDLARKDLDDARALGTDISEIEKGMASDLALKTVVAREGNDMQPVSSQTVSVIEGPNKIITGEGEYVLFISGDTVIRDKSGRAIPAAEIRPGDSLDFSCASAYINRADGMTHCSAGEITLNRDASGKAAADASGKHREDADSSLYLRLINQRLDKMDNDIRELKEKLNQPAKARKAAVKVKPKKKKAAKKTVEQKAGTGEEKTPTKKPSEW